MSRTFAINEKVEVLYGNAWVTGYIISGLHRVGDCGSLGYKVKFLAQRDRYVEGEFLQDDVKAAPTDSQYT